VAAGILRMKKKGDYKIIHILILFSKKKEEEKIKEKGITRIKREVMWMNLVEGIMNNTIRN